MRIGIFGDVHLTKNMRSLQSVWEETAIKSITSMYDKFDEEDVEMVVCLGDFFDAPRLEAKSMDLVLPLLYSMDRRLYPTYILLGNHEAESSDHNILEILHAFDNISPITSPRYVENMLFLPYYADPQLHINQGNIVFTHHDIYGSMLASGQVKASFGISSEVFKDARLVVNGHVHLKSRPARNIINAGSLLVSQQGELRVGDYPSYYILDTNTLELKSFDNIHSMIYQAIDIKDTEKVVKYESDNLVLRVDYEGEIPQEYIATAHTSWRKKIESIEDSKELVVNTSNFDMKNYIVEYIKKDSNIPEEYRDSYVETALELLR